MAADPLSQAAGARHERTVARAEQALRELDAACAPVSFQAVARRAGISRQWLYTQPGLRARTRRSAIARRPRRTGCRRASGPARPRCAGGSSRCAPKTIGCARRTRLKAELAIAYGRQRDARHA